MVRAVVHHALVEIGIQFRDWLKFIICCERYGWAAADFFLAGKIYVYSLHFQKKSVIIYLICVARSLFG